MSAENLLKKFTHPIERFIILNKATIFFKKIYSLNSISFIKNKKFVSIDEFYNDYFLHIKILKHIFAIMISSMEKM